MKLLIEVPRENKYYNLLITSTVAYERADIDF